jgi:hypothetical protein
MSDVTLVSADTGPSLSGTLTNAAGVPINLTTATVKFQMRRTFDSRLVVNANATVVSGPAGTVRYDWVAGDLAMPGDYISRWQITFADLSIQHSEPENTITIEAI